jgi:indoleamine 2,3-dioxygenase
MIAIKSETTKDRRQVARIFLIMSFLVHGYVRGGLYQETVATIPETLAVPFKQTAQILGCLPIVNYSSTVLFNWALIDPGKPPTLDNLRCLNTITGSPDEAWFYLVSVAMEAGGGEILAKMFKMQESVDNDDFKALSGDLLQFASLIKVWKRYSSHLQFV